MANEENLKPWKPGESGNPAGRAPDPFKKYSKDIVKNLLNEMLEMTSDELQKIGDDASESGLRRSIARAIRRAWSTGRFSELNEILDRIIGRVPQKNQFTGPDDEPMGPPTLIFNPVTPLPPPPEDAPPAQLPPPPAPG